MSTQIFISHETGPSEMFESFVHPFIHSLILGTATLYEFWPAQQLTSIYFYPVHTFPIKNLHCLNVFNYNIKGIHKRMMRFQKLIEHLFLTLHGHNIRHQQRELFKFLMRHQQLASYAYCVAAGPVSKMASHKKKAFCVARFEVSRSVITVQREFRARFKEDTQE
jgi:hypothetical protein